MMAALAVAVAMLVFQVPKSTRMRMSRAIPRASARQALSRTAPPRARSPLVRGAAVALGCAIAIWIGGWLGVLMGIAATGISLAVLARLEPRSTRQRRDALRRQLAPTAELLAACLSSGATVEAAVVAVAAASPEPMRSELDFVRRALQMGAREPWARLQPSPLARALERSRDSGAPLSEVLTWIATEARRESRGAAERAARAAGVHAVAPLAACFLPSFLLVAVVPVVADLAQSMWH